MLYKDWLNEWLKYHVKPSAKSQTYQKYCVQVNKHILPKLGELDMEQLSARVLQAFTTELTESGYASGTVNCIVSVLRSSLKRAVAVGAVSAQHCEAIVRPKRREKQVGCFGVDEQQKIERYIANSKKDKLFGIVLCLYMGFRIGELLALTWDDIDLSAGIVTVSRSCHDGWNNGRYVKRIEPPKTSCAYRSVPIPKTLLPYLKQLKKRSRGSYVIAGKTDQGAEIRSYQRTFQTLLKKIGVSKRGFHALRHTFATRALEVGVDVKTLSELLGHSDASVTLKRYAHSMLKHKCEMMDRLGKLLR